MPGPRNLHARTPVLAERARAYRELKKQGHSELDTSAVVKLYL